MNFCRSARNTWLMVATSWVLSAAISLPPLFGGLNADEYVNDECVVSQDPGYTVYSTVGAFYLPLAIILIIYAKV